MPREQVGDEASPSRHPAAAQDAPEDAERERKRLKAERREKKRAKREARAAAEPGSPASDGEDRMTTDAQEAEHVSVHCRW